MNKGILWIFFFLCTLTASAQYGGDLILGGRVNYVGGGKIVTPDGGRVNAGFTLKVAPSLAYFIRNGIAVGVITSYEFMKDSQGRQHTGEILPFLVTMWEEVVFVFYAIGKWLWLGKKSPERWCGWKTFPVDYQFKAGFIYPYNGSMGCRSYV